MRDNIITTFNSNKVNFVDTDLAFCMNLIEAYLWNHLYRKIIKLALYDIIVTIFFPIITLYILKFSDLTDMNDFLS